MLSDFTHLFEPKVGYDLGYAFTSKTQQQQRSVPRALLDQINNELGIPKAN